MQAFFERLRIFLGAAPETSWSIGEPSEVLKTALARDHLQEMVPILGVTVLRECLHALRPNSRLGEDDMGVFFRNHQQMRMTPWLTVTCAN